MRQPVLRASGCRRHLIEKADHVTEAAVLKRREIRALDAAVAALRTKLPGKAHLIAIAVGLSHEGKTEVRELSLHASNQGDDLVVAVSLHEGITVGAGFGPEVCRHGLAAIRIGFVPESDVTGG